MSPDPVALAKQLAGLRQSRSAGTALTAEYPGLDLDLAYAVQEAGVRLLVAAGERPAGFKLGLTSRAKQAQMGVAEPLYGELTDAMLLDVGQPLDTGELIQPRVEPEIAFLLGADLAGDRVTAAQVLAATAAVTPAVEVLDSRYAGYAFTLPDVVADNASAARLVLGASARPPTGSTCGSSAACSSSAAGSGRRPPGRPPSATRPRPWPGWSGPGPPRPRPGRRRPGPVGRAHRGGGGRPRRRGRGPLRPPRDRGAGRPLARPRRRHAVRPHRPRPRPRQGRPHPARRGGVQVVADTLDTPIDRVRVLVSEVDPDLWGIGGVPYSVARGPVESPRPARARAVTGPPEPGPRSRCGRAEDLPAGTVRLLEAAGRRWPSATPAAGCSPSTTPACTGAVAGPRPPGRPGAGLPHALVAL